MLQRFKPTKAIGDMEKAAQTAAERHFLMLQVYFWVFFSIWAVQHGLKTCYGENEEYKE